HGRRAGRTRWRGGGVSFDDPFEEPIRRIPGAAARDGSVLSNIWRVAQRELRERVRSRLFFVSTVLLALLAVAVSLTPVLIKVVDRGMTTTIAVASNDPKLAATASGILGFYLNPAKATVP